MAVQSRRNVKAQARTVEAPAGSSGEDIAHRLTFLLHRLVSALVDAASPEYREYGLSIPAARTVVSLLESGGSATVGSLADTTCIDLSTMSHILRRLEAQKYVKRQRQTDDNRVVMAVLTAKGQEIAQLCRQASLKHEAVLVRGMSPAEVARLKEALVLAFDNAKTGL